ncbi:MAG: helix-hairpin-helix domain-containing protein, partial [bacterium]|nr:helix-hairpin-helix domain-containing protein [bacterium]
MFNLTRREQLIALILIGGIIVGGVVLWLRRDPAPPTPKPLEYEINLSEVDRENRRAKIDKDNEDTENERELIDVNKADEEELQIVPGIGPKTAVLIIERREEKGPFKNINELIEIYGIGEKK